MNSLEFINKEIQYWLKTINTARSEKLTQTIIVSLNPLYKVENATLSDYDILLIEEKVSHLQQIKTILEAWEICKEDCVISPVLKDFSEGKGINWHRLPKKQQEKLKQALEVEDE